MGVSARRSFLAVRTNTTYSNMPKEHGGTRLPLTHGVSRSCEHVVGTVRSLCIQDYLFQCVKSVRQLGFCSWCSALESVVVQEQVHHTRSIVRPFHSQATAPERAAIPRPTSVALPKQFNVVLRTCAQCKSNSSTVSVAYPV
jgi:hypothetical protein